MSLPGPETADPIRAAFARVADAPPRNRAAILASLPADIREEVASLVAALDDAGGFMAIGDGPAPATGAVLGAYRLLEEIGRGGMGVVYRASRQDGEFQHDVAIKVAHGRFLTREGEHRFIQERQILAALDHPHIVRLLDGGVAAGHRYFVMEL